MSTFRLGDDGTTDTVIVCNECGEEFRFNYDPQLPDTSDSEDDSEDDYNAWIDECLDDAADEHDCTNIEANGPQDGDITTENRERYYQYGKLVLQRVRTRNGNVLTDDWYYRSGTMAFLGTFGDDEVAAVRAYMDKTQFWPNVWDISDHGNAHLMTL